MASFSTRMEADIQRAESEWRQHHKVTPELSEIMNDILKEGNPYMNATLAMLQCWEFSKSRGGQTLCHQFLYALKDMRDRGEECVSDQYLTDAVMRRALYTVVKQANNSLFELTCKIYAVSPANAEIFEPVVVELMQGNLIAEAARIAVQIGRRDEFVDGLAMPLVLLDKSHLLETMLEGLPHVQQRVLRIFDDHYEDSAKVQQIVRRYDIANVKRVDRSLWKKIAKLMTRYLKKYGLPPDTCPHLQLSRNRSALRYLLMKRYQDKDMAENSWREMVMDQVSDYQVLHYELMRALFTHNDMKCAHYFALKLDYPHKEWPIHFLKYVASLPPGTSPLDELENNNAPSNFLPVELRSEQIQIICNEAEFEAAASQLAKSPIVGVDAEWKPAMGLLKKTRLSLIQMATRDTVYLFDVLKLSDTISPEDWASFYKRVFDNPTGCILGFGIAEDLRKLEGLSGTAIFMTHIKDLMIVRDALQSYRAELMESVVEPKILKNHNGLSKLTCRLLGYPLDKSEQCSDWENRPLRTSQVHYAALDAHCLLRCWDELDRRCGDEDINVVVEDAIRYLRDQADSSAPKPSDLGCRANRGGRKSAGGHSARQSEHSYNLVASLGIGYSKNHARRFSPSSPERAAPRYTRQWSDRASSSLSSSNGGPSRIAENGSAQVSSSADHWRPKASSNSRRDEASRRDLQAVERPHLKGKSRDEHHRQHQWRRKSHDKDSV